MSFENMLEKAINSKNVNIPYLDELIAFMPQACGCEAVSVVQTALISFRNNCIHLADFLRVEGEGRKALIDDVCGEQVFFSSDIRRRRNDALAAPHNRVFMSVSFLENALDMGSIKPLSFDAQKLMYGQAQQYKSENSEFLYSVLGLIYCVQQLHYEFIDFHETENKEMILVFHSKNHQYKMISIMLNFKALLLDRRLLEALDADESEIMLVSEDLEERLSVTPPTYLH